MQPLSQVITAAKRKVALQPGQELFFNQDVSRRLYRHWALHARNQRSISVVESSDLE